ncbi:MAG TPA: hypothetical protein VGR69_04095 [Candidatus Rubrimentiphilum sp.]|nr:hypothetical protein [Candidatus Rubrimentiphilum sp.]
MAVRLVNQAVGRGTEMLADRVDHYSDIAHDVSKMLRDKDEPQAADLIELVAGGVHDAAQYLRDHDGTAIWNDAQQFARGRSWLLAGMGLIGGLAAARAVRSTTQPMWQAPDYAEPYPQSGYGSSSYTESTDNPIYGQSSFNGTRNDERL